MDEKTQVETANKYIKLMANGINPLTGEVVSDDDLINNVKISRCLFYVSRILDKYYDGLGTESRKRVRKSKFYASSEDLSNYNYSNEPIYVSIIADRINECFQKENMRKLSTTTISNWLVTKGYLVVYTREDGRVSKKPTSLGDEIGIKSIYKDGLRGPYMINTYNINAQKFIIDNIDDICKSVM